MEEQISKYPRTRHVEGSRLQPGDRDLEQVLWRSLAGRHLVIEEKVDGANSGVSFTAAGELRLQSRGHYLTGGARERHFALLKTWAVRHREALWQVLGSRYLMYGEWLYAKHTIFYDRLPHYFLEFDVLDRERGEFLDTPRRRALLASSPVTPVPVLRRGRGAELPAPGSMVGRSLYKSPDWRQRLAAGAERRGLDAGRAVAETDPSDEAEGLYLKVEEDGRVVDRLKWIRPSFQSAVAASGSHWLDRPILPNQLAGGVDIFEADGAPPARRNS